MLSLVLLSSVSFNSESTLSSFSQSILNLKGKSNSGIDFKDLFDNWEGPSDYTGPFQEFGELLQGLNGNTKREVLLGLGLNNDNTRRSNNLGSGRVIIYPGPWQFEFPWAKDDAKSRSADTTVSKTKKNDKKDGKKDKKSGKGGKKGKKNIETNKQSKDSTFT